MYKKKLDWSRYKEQEATMSTDRVRSRDYNGASPSFTKKLEKRQLNHPAAGGSLCENNIKW